MIDESRAKGLGIRAYVNKPILVNDIAEAIRRVLVNKESSGQE